MSRWLYYTLYLQAVMNTILSTYSTVVQFVNVHTVHTRYRYRYIKSSLVHHCRCEPSIGLSLTVSRWQKYSAISNSIGKIFFTAYFIGYMYIGLNVFDLMSKKPKKLEFLLPCLDLMPIGNKKNFRTI